ncbi:MAG TPA: RagB/SusD family nutrient uptake outer membrane protein [Phnomibacter sp.]|nr:RagB/SusD family nutrient uptake outer membrane protein [Phnomibacter sp.]
MKTLLKQYPLLTIGILGASVIFNAGCSKQFLEVDPQGQQPATTFYTSADDATKAVNAVYGNLREWNQVAFAAIAVESVASDDAEKGSSAGDATFFNTYDNFTVSSTEGQLQGFWTGQYQEINLANQAIDNIPAISMDEGLKARYIAEAKVARAYAHFRLVRAFGDVPLRIGLPKTPAEYNLPRTPKADVYAAIEKDLTEAAAVLPASYPAADLGRFTKGAALALHAKVAMYQKKWNDVLSLTNQVAGLGYNLFPDYEKQFRVENENNIESVFEIQASLVQGSPEASNSQYSQVQGVRGSQGGGWGFNVPTANLASSYEAGDKRKEATIIFRGETTPQGDVIPATGDNPMYNQKSYVPFSMYISGYNEGAQQNIRVIRFADVLLMNAEALNELGQTANALVPLNRVRTRAGLAARTSTDQAIVRSQIYSERRAEFAMEFDRYFDVLRQGRGAEVFGPLGWKANKNEVWPIPQNEIDLSAGILIQNPNY